MRSILLLACLLPWAAAARGQTCSDSKARVDLWSRSASKGLLAFALELNDEAKGSREKLLKSRLFECLMFRAAARRAVLMNSGRMVDDNKKAQPENCAGAGDYLSYAASRKKLEEQLGRLSGDPAMTKKIKAQLAGLDRCVFGLCYHWAQVMCRTTFETADLFAADLKAAAGQKPVPDLDELYTAYHLQVNPNGDPYFASYVFGATPADYEHNFTVVCFHDRADKPKTRDFSWGYVSAHPKSCVVIDAWGGMKLSTVGEYMKGDKFIVTPNSNACAQFIPRR